MYIRKTTKIHKGKAYTNYLLVESLHTPKGPRQRIICSLGSLAPAPREQWLSLAHRLEGSLEGQDSLPPVDSQMETLVEKVRRRRKARTESSPARAEASVPIAIDPERVKPAPCMPAIRCGSSWG